MKNFKKVISLSLMFILVIAMSICTAFADMTTEEAIEYAKENINAFWFKGMTTTNASETDDTTFTIIDSKGTVYYLQEGYTVDDFVTKADIQKKSDNVTKNTIDIINDLGLEADTGAATNTLSGFVLIINILLGVVLVIIIAGLGVFTAFDVCYIVFPVFRNMCEDAKISGEGPMAKRTANGGTKLRWVSDEAQYAVQHCSIESGQNPLTVYLRKRILAYIFVTIIIFILLTGNITILTNIALKVVSFIINTLSTIV